MSIDRKKEVNDIRLRRHAFRNQLRCAVDSKFDTVEPVVQS